MGYFKRKGLETSQRGEVGEGAHLHWSRIDPVHEFIGEFASLGGFSGPCGLFIYVFFCACVWLKCGWTEEDGVSVLDRRRNTEGDKR